MSEIVLGSGEYGARWAQSRPHTLSLDKNTFG